jgi:F420-dependent oxidoreductase-like protein
VRLRVLMEPRHGATYEQIVALGRAAEDGGFDGFFRGDHYLGTDAGDPSYLPTDSWTTLAGVAVQTSTIRLGTLMTAGTFRQPGQVAIIAATVDAMSGGRAELGIGTGWYEREHRSFGIPFPPLGERFDRLEEQLSVITGLWSTPRGERFSYAGKHYQLDECANFPAAAGDLEAGDAALAPAPRPRPRPRIIIGGGGPRRTPELAARFADEFNTGLGLSDDVLADRFGYVRGLAAGAGRDPGAIRMSTTLPVCCGASRGEAERRAASLGEPGVRLLRLGVVGAPRDVLDRVDQLAAAGADTVYFHLYDVGQQYEAAGPGEVRLLGEEVVSHAR